MLKQAASKPEIVDGEVRGAGWKFSENIFEPVQNSVALPDDEKFAHQFYFLIDFRYYISLIQYAP